MPTLNFKGKSAVESYHLVVPHHVLEFDAELSLSEKPSLDDNLIIEGDNLLALKALLPTHAGKIKCVYIDPPYNTGNEGWIYNDNLTQPMFKEWVGKVVGKEGEDLTRHDKWCCMMYPRLQLLKELLADDGVILVSIDDNEQHHLRMLLNEVFDEQNFIAQLVWEKGRKNDATFVSVGHEYVLIYAKNKEILKSKGKWRYAKPGAKEIYQEFARLRSLLGDDYKAIELKLREFYDALPKAHPSKKHRRYSRVDARGVWRDDNLSWPGGDGPTYDVPHPVTGLPCVVPEGGWRYPTPERMQEKIEAGVVEFRADHTEPPIRKTYLVRDDSGNGDLDAIDEEPNDIAIEVLGSYFYRSALQASNTVAKLIGKRAFEYPKDHEVLAKWFDYVTYGEREAVFLDPTAGSGSTAHAVSHLNRADNGNRKFILIQLKHDSESDRAKGINICESVTRRRVLKADDSVLFTYAQLGKSLFDQFGSFKEGEEPSFLDLAKYVFYTETSSHFDEKQVDQQSGFIGRHGKKSYYLIYSPNGVDDAALTTEWLDNTFKSDPGPKVVYAERIMMRTEDIKAKNAEARQVPFNLK